MLLSSLSAGHLNISFILYTGEKKCDSLLYSCSFVSSRDVADVAPVYLFMYFFKLLVFLITLNTDWEMCLLQDCANVYSFEKIFHLYLTCCLYGNYIKVLVEKTKRFPGHFVCVFC